jgi:hypothetical protein
LTNISQIALDVPCSRIIERCPVIELMTFGVSLPTVSRICLTFGRPRFLEEAIESFLRQDYPGEAELIVLNDLPRRNLLSSATRE